MLKNVQYSEKGQFKAKTERLRKHLIFYHLIIFKPKPFLGVIIRERFR